MIYPIEYVFQLTRDLNLIIFNMINGLNKSKILTKHISCKYKSKFYGRKCISNQKFNNNKFQWKCKNPKEYNPCEKDYIWNPDTCSCENVEYLASTFEDSVIMCD